MGVASESTSASLNYFNQLVILRFYAQSKPDLRGSHSPNANETVLLILSVSMQSLENLYAVRSEPGQLTANQRFRHSDLVTDFVTVILPQSEGLGKMALRIIKYAHDRFLI